MRSDGQIKQGGSAETFFAFRGEPRTRVADTAAAVLLEFAKFLRSRRVPKNAILVWITETTGRRKKQDRPVINLTDI